MFKLLARLVINGAAIWAAAWAVDGVTFDTANVIGMIAVIVTFALVNAVLKPLVKLLSFPFIILTLGLFTLVVNAGLFALTAAVTEALTVTGFFPAFWGAIIVSIVSWLLGIFVDDDDDED